MADETMPNADPAQAAQDAATAAAQQQAAHQAAQQQAAQQQAAQQQAAQQQAAQQAAQQASATAAAAAAAQQAAILQKCTTAVALVTYEEAVLIIGTIPTMYPRPNAQNIKAATDHLVEQLTTIPSQQNPDLGHSGAVQAPEIYALHCTIPWLPWINPGPTRTMIPGQSSADVSNEQAKFQANSTTYQSEVNILRATIDGLNKAVPKAYKRMATNMMGSRIYRPSDNPRDILTHLRSLYGQPTPAEKEAQQRLWDTGWDPNSPIETLFDHLEECYLTSVTCPPTYTNEQLIDKGLTAMRRSGLFTTAILEWTNETVYKGWVHLKEHFIEAYNARLMSGLGTAGTQGYHGAANAEYNDDDSIESVKASFANMQMANNANATQMNVNMETVTSRMKSVEAALAAAQQQLAMMAQAPPPAAPYHYPPPPAPHGAYAAYPAPPAWTQQPPPGPATQYQQAGQRSGGYGKKKKKKAWTGKHPGFASQPPGTTVPFVQGSGAIPPPGGQPGPPGGGPSVPNPMKYYNNWSMCYSCGFDVPGWHNSQSCPMECRKSHHQTGCNRANAQGYLTAGHKVTKKGMNKTQLPTNPGPDRA